MWVLAIGAAPVPVGAATCDQQATLPRPIPLGVSGGNINAFTNHNKFCFSGTLGSMVQDESANQYILSNNHVLADINKAKPGDLIVEPGLAENAIACQQIPGDAVATFTRTVKIKFSGKNTIDAAIAAVDPGDVAPRDSQYRGHYRLGGDARTRTRGTENGPHDLLHDRNDFVS